MRPSVSLFMFDPHPARERRCCSDEPVGRNALDRPAAPRRWSRKLRIAVPSSLAVFRRTVATPVDPAVAVGTRVVTTRGRELGHVREVLVALPGGRTSYAIQQDDHPVVAPVLLVPRDAFRSTRDGGAAVVDERAVPPLRKSA
jgi:hypothetical protein